MAPVTVGQNVRSFREWGRWVYVVESCKSVSLFRQTLFTRSLSLAVSDLSFTCNAQHYRRKHTDNTP